MMRAKSELNRQMSQNFWNKMRKQGYDESLLALNKNKVSHAYDIPKDSFQAFYTALYNNSIFRKMATVHQGTVGDLTIYSYEGDTAAQWGRGDLPELFEEIDSPIKKPIEAYRLSVMTHIAEETALDNEYHFRTVISEAIGKGLANAEDNAFINGTGVDEPTGILHETDGAEIGVTVPELTFDTVTQLFFSLDKEFRTNAKWILNDETALQLRLLKSENGVPLWNHNTDTIFSREIVISNDMPSTGTPIAFGDFKNYAIVQRIPLTMNVLHEKFALNGHIGYVGYEFLDAKLIRQDAVKLLKLESE